MLAHTLAASLLLAPQDATADTVFRLDAVAVESAPVVDGIVEPDEWAGAAVATQFLQMEPRQGDPASEPTEVLVMQDQQAIYVAFRVYDSGQPTAQITRRDARIDSDDAVVVTFDTYRDRQTGYAFLTNLLGTQQDLRVADDGRTVDLAWDGEWDSAATRTDYGWSAEFAIPFSTLRYEPGEGRTWGVNFSRTIRRNLEMASWAGPVDVPYRISQAGVLTGLELPPPLKFAEAIVYGLARASTDQDTRWDAGGDIRINPDPSVTINGTVNPDFATIEADRERVNLTRFELSLTEKRPFFLEGNELYRQRIRTFYSRRISDIRAGGRVLGKRGGWTYAAMAVGGEPDEDGSPTPFYSVGSLRRDFGRSTIGATFAERRMDGSGSGSIGADVTWFFSDRIGFTGQAIQSFGEFDTGTTAFFLRPAYDSPTTHFHVRYTHMGDRFGDNVNAIGFIRDDNRREIDSAFDKTFWLGGGPIERLDYGSNYNIYWGQDGTRRSWQIDQAINFEFRNRFALEIEHQEEFKLFEKEFRNRETGITLGYNTREFTSAFAELEFGRAFDRDFILFSAGGSFKPTESSSITYSLDRLTLDPDPEGESTWIHVLRANQFFTNDLFIQAFLQSNSVIDRREAQVAFVYRYKPPFGTIQLAFQRGRAEFGERSDQGNTLFLKATWVF